MHIIIPRVTYARLICSRQHRSYLLVPRVLEVPGDPLFHLYRPYLEKNKNILELLYFNAKEKLATKTSNLFFNIYTNRVAKLCCVSTTHVQTCLASNQADSWVVISCPIGACLITICIPFLTLATKETETKLLLTVFVGITARNIRFYVRDLSEISRGRGRGGGRFKFGYGNEVTNPCDGSEIC